MVVAEVRPVVAASKSEIGGWQFWYMPTQANAWVSPILNGCSVAQPPVMLGNTT
jgi:hypothetical protein